MSQRQWTCAICSTAYSRLEHLRRHARSHVMRRHERTCRAQADSSESTSTMPTAWAKPRTQTGTIQISRSTAMDTNFQGERLPDISPEVDFAALDFLYSSQWTSDSISLAESLEYLAYFTSANGMGTFLDQDTLQERQRLVLESEVNVNFEPISGCINPGLLIDDNYSETLPTTSITYRDEDPLGSKAEEIIERLERIINDRSEESFITIIWDSHTQDLCHTFFTPHNIRRYLGYFWALWYPNCPIVHRPSFDPQNAPVALLSVMIIIGACLSPHADDAEVAKLWLDSVEQIVFTDNHFGEEDLKASTTCVVHEKSDWNKRRIECIQMTYLVCSLQKREGSLEAQTRIRRYRHATMVTLARDIGLGSGNHRALSLDSPSPSWWNQFSTEEELLRTLTYVFLFDAALTIFHNSPPRMVVSELKMEVTCPEGCFQAESAVECFTLLKEWENTIFWRKRLSIAAVVRMMCQKDLDDILVRHLARIGTLNMFTTVQSLHSLTFHLQNSIIFESSLAPVETGLENWRRIWDVREPEDKDVPNRFDTIWRKNGFTCYAAEFWQLARIIVAKMRARDAEREQDTPSVPGQSLHRYDHTDMTDVNSLIMEYRRLNLGVATST
ncbi:hypothetical protein BDV59DRAFT_209800 [Aspergillus ambiguus]|uniref:transcription factor domain-containing protein n=1 Tax=Aspergillus ambiguus TaxID=176160 RepID=UPI003CCE0FA5